MAVRTKQYFIDKFATGYTLTAEDMDDLVESVAFAVDLVAQSGGPTGPAGGELTGTYPNPGLREVLPGGKTVTYPRLVIDAFGRVVSAESLDPGNGSTPNASGIGVLAPLTGANVQAELEAVNQLIAQIQASQSGQLTGAEIVALLEALAGEDRLDASAIKNLSSGSGIISRSILTRPGISVDVEYTGPAPVLSGSGGNYTITILAGCSWRVIDIEAVSGSSATDGNTFSFTVANENTGNPKDRAIAQIKDLGTNEILEWPKQERNITRTETIAGSGQVTNAWTAIGALDGFAILLTR